MTKKTAEKTIARALQTLYASEFGKQVGYLACHNVAVELRAKARAEGRPPPPIDVIYDQLKARTAC